VRGAAIDEAGDLAVKHLLVQQIRHPHAEAVLVLLAVIGISRLLEWRAPDDIFELSTSSAGIALSFTFEASP
jgi:hypothetical protein